MYAVIETGSKQFKVQEGDVIQVELLNENVKSFDKVLVIGGEQPKFGTPFVSGASVGFELLGQTKAKKIIVFKMKRRKSYRRTTGHRQKYSTVKITSIKG